MTSSSGASVVTHPSAGKSANRWSLVTAFLTGGFGVLSGFAIFFLLLEKADKPWMFLAVLGIASVLSGIFEWLREQIEHRPGKAHESWSPARFFVFLIVIAFAEFHVMSWETFTQISASHEFSTVIFSVLGSSLVGSSGVYLDLVVLFGFWVLAGAVLALALLAQLNPTEGGMRERLLRGGWIGLRTGALVAPLCLLAYVLAIWLLRGLYLLVWKQQVWIANVESLRAMAAAESSWIRLVFPPVFSGLLKGVALFGGHPAGPVVVVAVAVAIVVTLVKKEIWLAVWIVGAGVAASVMAPLLLNLDAVFQLLLRAALVWSVPGLVLGAMSPLLRVQSETERPKAWALIAFASAVVLFVVTVFRFKSAWWLLAPAVLFLAIGFSLRKASRADGYWLPMAAALAVLVGGLMLGVQNVASFAGVYDAMHRITSLPSELPRHKSGPGPIPLRPPLDLSNLAAFFPSILQGGGIGTTLRERLKNARETIAALEALQQDFNRAESTAAVFKRDVKCLEEEHRTLDAHANWFEQMDHTVESHRALWAMLRSVEENGIVPLEQLRNEVTAVRPPVTGLTESTLRPDANESPELQELRRLRFRIDQARNELLVRIEANLASMRRTESAIKAIKTPVEARERSMRNTAVRWLELALAGSLGYWTAISLLVGWSMQRQTATHPTHHAAK
jgi:hypothetical protein